jgi:FSR family fosmidomycin resistance protein-like MFS transporter
MSYFNLGGNIGYAAAPIVVTPFVLWLGLKGGLIAGLPVLLIAFALRNPVRYLGALRSSEQNGVVGRNRRGALGLLIGIVMLRHVAWFGVLAFAPLYALSLGHSKAYASHLLSAMLVAGAFGSLFLGRVADRFGLRETLLLTLVALPLLMVAFVTVKGRPGELALIAIGFLVAGTFGVTAVLGQLYLPSSVATAAGLIVGFPTAFGGIATVMLGAVADIIDLKTALLVGAAAPAIGAVLCVFLPPPAAALRAGPSAAIP